MSAQASNQSVSFKPSARIFLFFLFCLKNDTSLFENFLPPIIVHAIFSSYFPPPTPFSFIFPFSFRLCPFINLRIQQIHSLSIYYYHSTTVMLPWQLGFCDVLFPKLF